MVATGSYENCKGIVRLSLIAGFAGLALPHAVDREKTVVRPISGFLCGVVAPALQEAAHHILHTNKETHHDFQADRASGMRNDRCRVH